MYPDDFTLLDYFKSKFNFTYGRVFTVPTIGSNRSTQACYVLRFIVEPREPCQPISNLFKDTCLEDLFKKQYLAIQTIPLIDVTLSKELLDTPYNELAVRLNLGLLQI
jgi:hypothetical protein